MRIAHERTRTHQHTQKYTWASEWVGGWMSAKEWKEVKWPRIDSKPMCGVGNRMLAALQSWKERQQQYQHENQHQWHQMKWAWMEQRACTVRTEEREEKSRRKKSTPNKIKINKYNQKLNWFHGVRSFAVFSPFPLFASIAHTTRSLALHCFLSYFLSFDALPPLLAQSFLSRSPFFRNTFWFFA